MRVTDENHVPGGHHLMLRFLSRLLSLVALRRALTAALTTIAFVNSYEHTVDWFAGHGQANARYALACIPELGVVLVILSLRIGGLNWAQRGILGLMGLGAVSLTLTSNLSAAGPGLAGSCAALVAPVFAICGFGLELLSSAAPASVSPATAHAGEPSQAVDPLAVVSPPAEPVSPPPVDLPGPSEPVSHEPVSPPAEPSVSPRPVSPREPLHLVDREPSVSPDGEPWDGSRLTAWLMAQETFPPIAQLMDQTGLSAATVKRARKAATAA